MALQLPSIQYLRGYEPKDILGEFARGHEFGRGLSDESKAGDLIRKLMELGGATPASTASPASPGAVVQGSHDAAAGATDLDLQGILQARFGAEGGADPMDGYMQAAMTSESGGDPNARNPNSSASGLFQFTDPTWADLVNRYGATSGLTAEGKNDPVQQKRAMGIFTRDNASALRNAGLTVSPGSLYATHFLGSGAAPKVLSAAAETPMTALVGPDVIEANPHLADMTQAEFVEWARSKGTNGSGGYSAPASGSSPMRQVARPNGELMAALFSNRTTRPLAEALLTQQSKTVDQWQSFTGPDGKLYQVNLADGKMQALGGDGVTVNTGDNTSAFRKKADEKAAERMDEIVSSGASAQLFMGDLEALRDIATRIDTGMGAQITNELGPYAEMFGIDIANLGEGQAFDAIVSRMAPQMRVPGSGASSDFDARQFLKSLPGLAKTPEGNALIIQTFETVQQHKIKAAEIASQAQSDQISWQEADRQIRALGDPFSAFKQAKKGGAAESSETDTPGSGEYPEGTIIANAAGQRMVMRGGEWEPM